MVREDGRSVPPRTVGSLSLTDITSMQPPLRSPIHQKHSPQCVRTLSRTARSSSELQHSPVRVPKLAHAPRPGLGVATRASIIAMLASHSLSKSIGTSQRECSSAAVMSSAIRDTRPSSYQPITLSRPLLPSPDSGFSTEQWRMKRPRLNASVPWNIHLDIS